MLAEYARRTAGQERVLICGCLRGDGGLGDALKQTAVAAMTALLSAAPPRALILDWERAVCASPVAIGTVWQPAMGGPAWVPPPGLSAAAAEAAEAARTGSGETPAMRAGFARLRRVNAGAETLTELLIAVAAHSARVVTLETNIAPSQAAFAAAAAADPGNLTGTWWSGGADGAGHSGSESCRLPPELAELLQLGGACAPSPPPLPPPRELPLELLDWLLAPAPPLVDRALALLAPAGAGPRLLIGVHLRAGTPAPGAGYEDPLRGDAVALGRLAAACAVEVGAALRALRPASAPPIRLVWFVASDSYLARDALRDALPAAAAAAPDGAPDAVLESDLRHIVHTDKSGTDGWTPENFTTAYVSVHAEHAILSAAHALVRSPSGFSSTAQAWGRVPRVRVLDLSSPGGGACVDDSRAPGAAALAAAAKSDAAAGG